MHADLKTSMNLNDEQLLSLFRQEEQKGFKAIFDMYYKPLCLIASRLCTDMNTAEDIVQTVFIGIWEGKKLHRVQTSIRSYLVKAVRNACLDHLEKNRKQIELITAATSDADWINPDNSSEIFQFPQNLTQAISQLPEGCRNVLNLVYFEGYSYKKTASLLHISVNTVKTQLTRAIRSIRLFCQQTTY
jgi:RNA polymerase sigma-70 factor (family 1)